MPGRSGNLITIWSGMFMFLTADIALAGAADMPACQYYNMIIVYIHLD